MFRLYKLKNNSEYLLYESEVRDGTDVRFKRVCINEKKLCNNNPTQNIILKMYHYSTFGAPKLSGETYFTIDGLMDGRRTAALRKSEKHKGTVQFNAVKRYTKY